MVSLFTRERIEILYRQNPYYNCIMSPSLRGSGLKSAKMSFHLHCILSPSLRGRGLKSYLDTMAKTQGVSLLQKNELTETSIVF